MQRRDLFLLGGLLALAAGFALYARAPARSAAAAFDGEPAVIAATFNAQWCTSCKILKPRLLGILPEFSGRPVKFVEYDLTFGDRPALRGAAEADGVASIYDRFSSATGYTLLVEARTGDVVDMLTINHSRAEMRNRIEAALARAAKAGNSS